VPRAVLLVALLAALALAPDSRADPLVGDVYLDDVVVVAPNATLELGPGVTVTGPGHIEVWGSLVVAGEPARRAEIAVPILLLGNGTSRADHARFWGVHGPAISVSHGAFEAHDVAFEASEMGLRASNDSRVGLTDAVFRNNAGPALSVGGRASVSLSRAVLEGNGRGIVVSSALSLLVADSSFRGDAPQVDVAWAGGPVNVSLARNDLGALHPTGGPLVAIRASGTGSIAVDDPPPLVNLSGNRIHGAAVGLFVAGPGPALESRNDTVDQNVVGVVLAQGTARLRGTTLGNDRDVEGGETGDLTLDNVTFLRAQAATLPQGAPGAFPWGAVGLGAVALALVGLVIAQPIARARERRRAAAAPPATSFPAPEPEEVQETPALTHQELRILRDVVANPGSPQAAVATRLGMTRQALHYHVKKLEARGLLVKVAKGRETLCHVPPGVAATLPPDGPS
jgi:predicted DNA-binding protein (UPF0251 family)